MYSSPPSEIRPTVFSPLIPHPTAAGPPTTQMEQDSSAVVLHHSIASISKAIPPPATVPRNPELMSSNQRVVFPPKEACFRFVFHSYHTANSVSYIFIVQLTHPIPKHSRRRHKVESRNTGPSHGRSCPILPLFRVGQI